MDMQIANILKNRIYTFRAERLNVGQSSSGVSTELASNANNLPEVLHVLYTSNPARYSHLTRLLCSILPGINSITIIPQDNNRLEIRVWSLDLESERDDLTTPLSESGTGIGQILAILYVVLTSNEPRTIIIDEPQSFLHPGAIRNLFEILRQYPQHQFIITTHSPIALTAVEPSTILLVRKEGSESTVAALDAAATKDLNILLSEVGVRLSDVFGADKLLWVEGPTEELCFPLILHELAHESLAGAAVLGVRQTGDFEGKHAKTIYEVYSSLSKGPGIIPPSLGFIFDMEARSAKLREDMERQSGGRVHFLPRRMYENYLLDPRAIAAVFTEITGGTISLSSEQVSEWFTKHKWSSCYFVESISQERQTEESWLVNVDGAKFLKDLFNHFSETTWPYDKVKYGSKLTQWLINNAPEQLSELSDFLSRIIDDSKQ